MNKFLVFFLCFNSFADNFDHSLDSEFSIKNRLFKDDKVEVNEDINSEFSLGLTYEARKESYLFFSKIDYSYDFLDNRRQFLNIEDLYYKSGNEDGDLSFLMGFKTYNFTSLEAFDSINSVNSRILDSSVNNPTKRGEPVASLNKVISEDGEFTVFYMPAFISPTYPSKKSRLGNQTILEPAKIVTNKGELISGRGIDYDDYGNSTFKEPFGLWSSKLYQVGITTDYVLGDFEFHLQYFHHIDRENPIFLPDLATGKITPYYFEAYELGGTGTYILGDFIFKTEVTSKEYKADIILPSQLLGNRPDDIIIMAFGAEYGMALDSGHDITFYLESSRIINMSKSSRAGHLNGSDVAFITRYTLNDIASSEFYLALFGDYENTNEMFYQFKFERRIGETFKASASINIFDAKNDDLVVSGLEAYDDDDFVYLELSKFL